MNWGGETIYCAYDKGDKFKDCYLKEIKSELDSVSWPCIVWFTIKYRDLQNNSFQGYTDLYELMLQKNINNISKSIYINPCNIKIIKVEKLKK